ncbi:hypothetical protein E2562_018678 [Oryza meyeriana var. granulata]|uniref:Uncharacterized protein n=1 Tax=Oryza meyeriana var. granulata TaxID=110450 RepID=A0A6G1EMM3_9ORYZ|nr:hypothetical protein E2562_018678 [Oryza meyeriana var. granulata]
MGQRRLHPGCRHLPLILLFNRGDGGAHQRRRDEGVVGGARVEESSVTPSSNSMALMVVVLPATKIGAGNGRGLCRRWICCHRQLDLEVMLLLVLLVWWQERRMEAIGW